MLRIGEVLKNTFQRFTLTSQWESISHATINLGKTKESKFQDVHIVLNCIKEETCPFTALLVLHSYMITNSKFHPSFQNCTIAEFPSFFGWKTIDAVKLTAIVSDILNVHTTQHTWEYKITYTCYEKKNL